MSDTLMMPRIVRTPTPQHKHHADASPSGGSTYFSLPPSADTHVDADRCLFHNANDNLPSPSTTTSGGGTPQGSFAGDSQQSNRQSPFNEDLHLGSARAAANSSNKDGYDADGTPETGHSSNANAGSQASGSRSSGNTPARNIVLREIPHRENESDIMRSFRQWWHSFSWSWSKLSFTSGRGGTTDGLQYAEKTLIESTNELLGDLRALGDWNLPENKLSDEEKLTISQCIRTALDPNANCATFFQTHAGAKCRLTLFKIYCAIESNDRTLLSSSLNSISDLASAIALKIHQAGGSNTNVPALNSTLSSLFKLASPTERASFSNHTERALKSVVPLLPDNAKADITFITKQDLSNPRLWSATPANNKNNISLMLARGMTHTNVIHYMHQHFDIWTSDIRYGWYAPSQVNIGTIVQSMLDAANTDQLSSVVMALTAYYGNTAIRLLQPYSNNQVIVDGIVAQLKHRVSHIEITLMLRQAGYNTATVAQALYNNEYQAQEIITALLARHLHYFVLPLDLHQVFPILMMITRKLDDAKYLPAVEQYIRDLSAGTSPTHAQVPGQHKRAPQKHSKNDDDPVSRPQQHHKHMIQEEA